MVTGDTAPDGRYTRKMSLIAGDEVRIPRTALSTVIRQPTRRLDRFGLTNFNLVERTVRKRYDNKLGGQTLGRDDMRRAMQRCHL